MDHYLDIQLLPDLEFTEATLMSALYSKLHRALVTAKSKDIGISFPGYQRKPKKLGQILRVHGSQTTLAQLQSMEWLKGMRDHSVIADIRLVPENAHHCRVARRQFKTNAERLRRRRMKRKDETYEQALLAIPDSVEQKSDLPFLSLRSASTGQTFYLFIDQSAPQEQTVAGEFSSYGLSQQATVPFF